jgi:hypothetical protein
MNTSQINETFQLRGHTRIWKNDELIFDKDNAIISGGTAITATPTGLKDYLAQCLYGGTVVNTPAAPVDRAINDLMGTGDSDLTSSTAMETKDGILVMAESGDYGNATAAVRSMVTTNIAKTQPYGRKWRGVLTAAGAREFGHAVLGHNARSPEGDFTTGFAEQSFTTITLATADTLTIEWEVYIA